MQVNNDIPRDGSTSIERTQDGAPVPTTTGLRLLLGALLLVVGSAWCRGPRPGAAPDLPPVQTRIDPNVAPWWELSTLPRIGRATAEAIIAHRRQAEGSFAGTNRVFVSPVDLSLVRGIGPVTVQRLAPHMRFDAPVPPSPQRQPAPDGDGGGAS